MQLSGISPAQAKDFANGAVHHAEQTMQHWAVWGREPHGRKNHEIFDKIQYQGRWAIDDMARTSQYLAENGHAEAPFLGELNYNVRQLQEMMKQLNRGIEPRPPYDGGGVWNVDPDELLANVRKAAELVQTGISPA